MRLFLVRHPPPLIAPGICYGSTDLGVAPAELARVLAALTGTLPSGAELFSSPLLRCADLAAALAASLDAAAPTVDARLAELDFGDWEMRRWDAIARAEIDAWAADMAHYRPGGGESVLSMAARVRDWRADLLRHAQEHAIEQAIVVCHAGTMRLLACCRDGLSLPEMALQAASEGHRIAYGSVALLDC